MKLEKRHLIQAKANKRAAGMRLSKFRPVTEQNRKKALNKKACRGKRYDVV